MSRIHESIRHLAVDITKLVPLDGNPRKGNVDAIMASYKEFGQVKPVVVRKNGDGTLTVIAGNHQVEACRRLGWSEVAVVEFDGDDARAIAFALADNRTTELGLVDSDLLFEMMEKLDEDYDDLFVSLGWDEFEFASLESDYGTSEEDNTFVPPVMIEPTTPVAPVAPVMRVVETASGEGVVAPANTDTDKALTQGSSAVVGNSGRAVVQYTLVFDDGDQQRRWYDFVRWLKTSPAYDGDTTAQRILSFIDAHSEI